MKGISEKETKICCETSPKHFLWSRLHMKLNMDKSNPRKTQGQLPFPFSQTNKLDERVPIAWRIADTLMPSARPRDISSQP